MEFLFDYLGFLARAVTIVIAILLVLGFVLSRKAPAAQAEGTLEVKHLNRELDDIKAALEGAVVSPEEQAIMAKARAAEEKKARKTNAKAAKAAAKKAGKDSAKDSTKEAGSKEHDGPGRVYVLNFVGDIQASALDQFRQEITSVLTVANPNDEVVVKLESGGGMVHSYGLAASQMQRIREKGIPLTATIDKVAASGGYMMAAVADKILAAPFAIVGSIGVVAQVPNVHRLLKKHDVDVELITAGEHKRTLTTLGENTDEAREKFTEQLEDIHQLFQEHVVAHRDSLDIKKVATGESWYGQRAMDVKLVDRLVTSDSYLIERANECEVYLLRWEVQKKPLERLLGGFASAFSRVRQGGLQGVLSWLQRDSQMS